MIGISSTDGARDLTPPVLGVTVHRGCIDMYIFEANVVLFACSDVVF